MKNPVLLSVRNYKQHFPINKSLTVHAVNGISFDLRKGEIFGLVGESGCGKSTVARAIMGIYTPTEGEIYFKDFLISEKRSYREHKKDIQRNMQVIFQDSAAALNPRMKVADIIAEPLVINRVYPDKVRLRAEVDKLLTLVGLDTSYGNKFPAEISGGQRQRVAIARALAMDPKVMLLDEPTSALDPELVGEVLSVIRDLADGGMTMIMATHQMDFARALATDILFMEQGKIIEQGAPDVLLAPGSGTRTSDFCGKLFDLRGTEKSDEPTVSELLTGDLSHDITDDGSESSMIPDAPKKD